MTPPDLADTGVPPTRTAAEALSAGSRELVVEEIRGAERFLVVTHEHPDGDALGSLVAMQGVLRALEKDSIMFIAENEFPLPQEYRFFPLDGLVTSIPDDLERRTVVFLDCGNIERNPAHLLRDVSPLLNIDHHHDNTHFGTVDHVVPEASCTAEIIWDLMDALEVPLTPTIADALYVGLITDTGRFSYENTGARSQPRVSWCFLGAGSSGPPSWVSSSSVSGASTWPLAPRSRIASGRGSSRRARLAPAGSV